MKFQLSKFYQKLQLKGHTLTGWYLEFDGDLLKVVYDNSKGSLEVISESRGSNHLLRVTSWRLLRCYQKMNGQKILMVE
jgi:hypothetical protein